MDSDELLASPDPAVSYRAHRRLAGDPDGDPEQQCRRREVAGSENVRRMLSGRRSDGTIGYGDARREQELAAAGRTAGAYRKWQGPHWTLAGLAELGYPPGDDSLRPVVEQVLGWLLAPRHLQPPSTRVFPGQEDRVRRCASMEGLALWYLHELGLADGRADELASRLVGWQWPDGGWNCDKNPSARTSSVQETLLPLRGLARHVQAGRAAPAVDKAIDRAAEFLLQRRLLWRRHDGAPIRPAWGRDPLQIQWPIRFYDVLFALVVMTEVERVRDPRCADALDHLAGKRLPGGGFPAEVRTARTVDQATSDGTFAHWGPSGRRRPNPYVTVDALWVLLAGLAGGASFPGVRPASPRAPRGGR
jgi:hypothetical protein